MFPTPCRPEDAPPYPARAPALAVASCGRPLSWWSCHGCQIPVDGDLARCPKCGTARLAICRTAGCERKPRATFAYCDKHTSELLTRAMARGQALAEYVLLAALIAIVAILALVALGANVSGLLSTVGGSI